MFKRAEPKLRLTFASRAQGSLYVGSARLDCDSARLWLGSMSTGLARLGKSELSLGSIKRALGSARLNLGSARLDEPGSIGRDHKLVVYKLVARYA